MIKFKIDENLPVEASGLLRQIGHDALTVSEQHLGGSPDPDVASVCQQEGRALVTLDVGFSDIRAYPPSQFPGLIILRLRWQDKGHILGILKHLEPLLSSEPLENHLWIVEETRVRIRG
jgi:predicted nuclease of predicted toxin-antitoxin system